MGKNGPGVQMGSRGCYPIRSSLVTSATCMKRECQPSLEPFTLLLWDKPCISPFQGQPTPCLHTTPCQIHYLALHWLLGGPAQGAISSVFSLSAMTASCAHVLTVLAHVVTTLLLTATQAHFPSVRIELRYLQCLVEATTSISSLHW